jgi:hypothetical protein
MANKKVIFVAFAIEDEGERDLLKGQSLQADCSFEYIDVSMKEAYDEVWKTCVRTGVRRSDGVIALVSSSSLTSSGQRWELACAKEEGKKVLGVWAYANDRTNLVGIKTIVWDWDEITTFIERL